jgi:hypothetical protein
VRGSGSLHTQHLILGLHTNDGARTEVVFPSYSGVMDFTDTETAAVVAFQAGKLSILQL